MPREGVPTIQISGIPLHRIKGIEPYKDKQTKVSTYKPITGNLVDPSLGLSHTGIKPAKHAEVVIAIELELSAIGIQKIISKNQVFEW